MLPSPRAGSPLSAEASATCAVSGRRGRVGAVGQAGSSVQGSSPSNQLRLPSSTITDANQVPRCRFRNNLACEAACLAGGPSWHGEGGPGFKGPLQGGGGGACCGPGLRPARLGLGHGGRVESQAPSSKFRIGPEPSTTRPDFLLCIRVPGLGWQGFKSKSCPSLGFPMSLRITPLKGRRDST
jgi:hypothetical protein